MNMSLLQGLVMGFVSGFAELLPISAEAHRSLLLTFFGLKEDAVFCLIIHLSCLLAVVWGNRNEILKLRRTSHLMKVPPKRRRHQPDMPTVYTVRLLRISLVFLILPKLFTMQLGFIQSSLNILAFTLILNGIVLLIPSLVRNGNKDSRNMPRMDGVLMGLCAGLSVIPGISQVGAAVSAGIARGVERFYALRFAYILMIPGLIIRLVFDLIAIIAGGAAAFSCGGLIVCVAGAVAAHIGCRIAMRFMRFLAFSQGYSSFAYYCWGAGLLCFILFLTV